MELVARNVVVTARQFNPSILSQLWLVRNKILAEDEFLEGTVLTPAFSNVQSKQFNLLVTPELLQFAPTTAPEEDGKLANQKVGGIIRALPETPYTALGMNLVWHLPTKGESNAVFSRRLFFRPGVALFAHFDTPNACFGSYLSKNFESLRLKLDIKPITILGAVEEDRLQFTFNFHKDLRPQEAVGDIERSLGLWEAARKHSQQIMTDSLKGFER